jgi:Cofilin/tropomyosin-type actin-binding protein
MLYYLPVTANSETRMMYAGAKELMRNTSEVGKIIEIESAEDLEGIEEKLKTDA